MRNRKPKSFYKSRGLLTGAGATAAEAKGNLERQIDWAVNNSTGRIESRYGLLIVITPTPQGYEHTVFDPTELRHSDSRLGCSCHGQVDFETVLQAARNQAAQNAWNLDVSDDEDFVLRSGLNDVTKQQLRYWINWQRLFIVYKNQGCSDGEAHHLACQNNHTHTAARRLDI